MCLALWQFLKLRDERILATGEIAVELPHLLAAAVQHDDGGKSKNFVLLSQLHVLLSLLRWLGFSARKIELHEDEIIVREVFELRLRENVLIEFDAPPAPVRTRKIEEKEFVVRFRFFLRLAVIVQPIRFRSCEASADKRNGRCDEK